jgi:hypothetical protein
VGFVDLEQREVNVESMCLGPWEFSYRVAATDPCASQPPVLKRFGFDNYTLYSNGCSSAVSDEEMDYTAEEVMMWPECSE